MPSGGNLSFTLESGFQPLTLQDHLSIGLLYKDAFEKAEEAYTELNQKADVFKDLSKSLPEDSKARKIYEKYANNLKASAEDFSQNGLTLGNRGVLSSLKRRYSGEIGRLERANEALKKAQETREALMASGKDMIYAVDNFGIDDFLDGKRPDMFAVNSDELYARGAAAGKAASSRVFTVNGEEKTLGDYYIDFIQKKGYSRDQINAFLKDPNAIPELRDLADNIIKERIGGRLTGANLERARQSIINGIVDGAIYEELHNPQRNLGKLTAYESAQVSLDQQRLNLQRAQFAASRADAAFARRQAAAKQGAKEKALEAAAKGSGKYTKLKSPMRYTWNGWFGNANPESGNATIEPKAISESEITGEPWDYSRLPDWAKAQADRVIGKGKASYYDYYFKPYSETFGIGSKGMLEMVPRDLETDQGAEAFLQYLYNED